MFNLSFVFYVFSVNDGMIDLLMPLGLGDEDLGIGFSAAGSQGPVFDITLNQEIQEPAAKYFGNSIIKDFGISIIMQMRSSDATLFSVVNPYEIIQLGLYFQKIENFQTRVTIFYTPDSRNSDSTDKLAEMVMPDITNQWTKVAIKVEGKKAMLYHDCKLVDSTSVKMRDSLVVEQGSTLRFGKTSGRQPQFFNVSSCSYISLVLTVLFDLCFIHGLSQCLTA